MVLEAGRFVAPCGATLNVLKRDHADAKGTLGSDARANETLVRTPAAAESMTSVTTPRVGLDPRNAQGGAKWLK